MTEHASPAEISVTYVVTADDLVATSRMAGRDAMPMIHISAAVMVVLGIVLWGTSATMGAVLIASGVGAAVLTHLPGFWRFWLRRQAANLIGEHRRFAFDEDGLHEERADLRHTTPWSVLTEMRITPRGVFLLRHNHIVQALPARAFPSPDALDRLIGLVSAHAPNIRIT